MKSLWFSEPVSADADTGSGFLYLLISVQVLKLQLSFYEWTFVSSVPFHIDNLHIYLACFTKNKCNLFLPTMKYSRIYI